MSERVIGLRDELAEFSQRMERALRKNDHKEHWSGYPVGHLLRRLKHEVGELDRAIKGKQDAERIAHECADVANFAMMLADVAIAQMQEKA